MTSEELKLLQEALKVLKESGALDQLMQTAQEPGGQTALIYSLIGLVIMMGFRFIVVDRVKQDIVKFHQDNLQSRQQLEEDFKRGLTIFESVKEYLGEITEKLVSIQTGQTQLYSLLVGRRQHDRIERNTGD